MLLLLQLVVGLLVGPVLVEPVVEQPGFAGLAVEQRLLVILQRIGLMVNPILRPIEFESVLRMSAFSSKHALVNPVYMKTKSAKIALSLNGLRSGFKSVQNVPCRRAGPALS